ncbi:MAG: S-layer homology domain-containing protein [Thermoleophilia bacterium]
MAFSDVPSTHPHARAINALAAQGVVSGKADGSFRPV